MYIYYFNKKISNDGIITVKSAENPFADVTVKDDSGCVFLSFELCDAPKKVTMKKKILVKKGKSKKLSYRFNNSSYARKVIWKISNKEL